MPVTKDEIVDATVLRAAALDAFLAAQLARATADDVLLSVHLKATMMKVSDPVVFGHVVRTYFADVFDTYGDELTAAGLDGSNGLGAILSGLADLEHGAEIRAAIEQRLADGPRLAMVNSDKGITNLHVPSDVIVDASMPAMIRTSGHMWGADGAEADTLAVIPDSSYAPIYQVVLDDCRANGAFDPTTMGSVPNVGLMAQKAEEYGSHDKTFVIDRAGTVQVVDGSGTVLLEHDVQPGDIWRACQTKDAAIRDWVKLAVTRARASGTPAIFWLDEQRAHDANLIAKVHSYLKDHDTDGLDITVQTPVDAMATSLERIRKAADHLGDGQRPARLPHRPLPDPRARHQRQDALGRPADERRRPVRDRSGRVGAEARPAAGPGEPPALGQPGRVHGPRGEPPGTSPSPPATRGRPRSPRPSTARPSGCSRRTSPRAVGSARSTTAAATPSSRTRGRRSSPGRPATPGWPPCSARSRRRWRPTSRRSSRTSSTSRARPWTSAATTGRTRRRPRP